MHSQHKSQKEYFRDFLILVCVEFYEVFLSISIFTSAGYFARATLSSFKSIPLVEYIRLRISQTSCQFMKIRENSSKNINFVNENEQNFHFAVSLFVANLTKCNTTYTENTSVIKSRDYIYI